MIVDAQFDPNAADGIYNITGTSGQFTATLPSGKGTVEVLNDSRSTIILTFPNGHTSVVPSGTPRFYNLCQPTSVIKWQQDPKGIFGNIGLPNNVYVTSYEPGEPLSSIAPSFARQSGASVAVIASALTNEGNPPATLVLDTGPVGNLDAFQLFNDHFIWSVIQSGVVHEVLKGNTAGNPLQIGQAGDTSEVLGDFLVDGTASLGPAPQVNGSIGGFYIVTFPVWGPGMKLMILTFHNYNSVLKNIALPSSLGRGFIVSTDFGGDTPTLQPKIGSTLVGFSAVTALGGSGNGSESTVANIKQATLGSIPSTIDNFDFTPGGVCNGTVIMLGH